MHTHQISIIAFGLLLFSSNAFATGGMSTGGGLAVVCRNGQNEVTKAELLDLFEGRERFHFTLSQSQESTEQQVEKALRRLKPQYRGTVKQKYDDIIARRILLPHHIGLHTSDDLGRDYAVYIQDGCRLEQVGYYEADGRLRIAQNIYNHLSSTNKSAFFIHETFYRMTRDAGARHSATARFLTAELFATSVTDEKLNSDIGKEFNANGKHHFIAVSYKSGAKFKFVAKNIMAPTIGAADVTIVNIRETELETLNLNAASPVAEIVGTKDMTTFTFPYSTVPAGLEIYYGDNLILEFKRMSRDDLGQIDQTIHISWQE